MKDKQSWKSSHHNTRTFALPAGKATALSNPVPASNKSFIHEKVKSTSNARSLEKILHVRWMSLKFPYRWFHKRCGCSSQARFLQVSNAKKVNDVLTEHRFQIVRKKQSWSFCIVIPCLTLQPSTTKELRTTNDGGLALTVGSTNGVVRLKPGSWNWDTCWNTMHDAASENSAQQRLLIGQEVCACTVCPEAYRRLHKWCSSVKPWFLSKETQSFSPNTDVIVATQGISFAQKTRGLTKACSYRGFQKGGDCFPA